LAGIAPAAQASEEMLCDLMARYQEADPGAPEELFAAVSPLLHRFIASPRFTRSQAEDLLQECWLRIHTARHTYRPAAPVLPWMLGIARHTRADGFRRQARLDSRETAFDQIGPGAAAHGSATGTCNIHLDLRRLLNGLPDRQREVVIMLKMTGMSLKEVAVATSSSVGAVKQRAHRAYAKLRRALQPAGWPGPERDFD
jgi:RNA polymerase sigma-70 factor, ECF subfamily